MYPLELIQVFPGALVGYPSLTITAVVICNGTDLSEGGANSSNILHQKSHRHTLHKLVVVKLATNISKKVLLHNENYGRLRHKFFAQFVVTFSLHLLENLGYKTNGIWGGCPATEHHTIRLTGRRPTEPPVPLGGLRQVKLTMYMTKIETKAILPSDSQAS